MFAFSNYTEISRQSKRTITQTELMACSAISWPHDILVDFQVYCHVSTVSIVIAMQVVLLEQRRKGPEVNELWLRALAGNESRQWWLQSHATEPNSLGCEWGGKRYKSRRKLACALTEALLHKAWLLSFAEHRNRCVCLSWGLRLSRCRSRT